MRFFVPYCNGSDMLLDGTEFLLPHEEIAATQSQRQRLHRQLFSKRKEKELAHPPPKKVEYTHINEKPPPRAKNDAKPAPLKQES
jgi:hypothetical protein